MPIWVTSFFSRAVAGQLAGLVDRLRERLLAVDVQPALEGAHGDRGVHVVGRRDVDRVEVLLLVEQLAPVLVDLDVREPLLDRRRVPQVDVGHGDELEVRAGGERRSAPRHARGAEAGVIEGLAWCRRRMGTKHSRHHQPRCCQPPNRRTPCYPRNGPRHHLGPQSSRSSIIWPSQSAYPSRLTACRPEHDEVILIQLPDRHHGPAILPSWCRVSSPHRW